MSTIITLKFVNCLNELQLTNCVGIPEIKVKNDAEGEIFCIYIDDHQVNTLTVLKCFTSLLRSSSNPSLKSSLEAGD